MKRDEEKSTVLDYIRDYCPDLEYQNNKIKLDEDLKKMLYEIEQRYYTTLVGSERRCATRLFDLFNKINEHKMTILR